jgi:hypothetical protein
MKEITLMLFILMSTVCSSQENNKNNGLEYKSVSFTPLAIYSDFETGGIAFSADVSFAYKKHIFTFETTTGAEFTIFDTGDSFEQLSVLYGREFMLNKTVFIDTHLGLGYFSFKSSARNFDRLTTIGIPLAVKVRYKTAKRFSIGIQFQANINSINNIYTIGVLLQWNKKK